MSAFDKLLQVVVSGLSVGSIYALIALGIVLLFRTTKILNFAHGDIGVLGTFIAYTLLRSLDIPFWAAFLLSLVAAAIIGMVIYLFVVRPAKNETELGLLILTLGLALTLGGADAIIFGTGNKIVPPLVTERIIHVGNAAFSLVAIITALVGVVLMVALWALLTYTKLGIAMRAVAQRPDVAEAMGLPVRTVLMATWASIAVLGTAAALMFAPTDWM